MLGLHERRVWVAKTDVHLTPLSCLQASVRQLLASARGRRGRYVMPLRNVRRT